ncbi:MAG: hypothetical protein KGL44_04180 [Sphingomonadales bacterium]|nr:hypothetical protein [Sphingomonadales bacterium]
MDLFRTFLLRHRALAFCMVLAALCMKLLVPTGYMIGQGTQTLTVLMCNDASGTQAVRQMVIPFKDSSGDTGHAQGKGECPYASLAMASLTGADPALLTLALVYILALGFAPAAILPRARENRLRPPLRGPPALI